MTALVALVVLSDILIAPTPALNGTWELDPAASSDPGPLLDYLGASALVKAGARTARPVQEIALTGRKLWVKVVSPLGRRETTQLLDGKVVVEMDLLGSAARYMSRQEGETIVSTGEVMVSGSPVPLEMRRWVAPDGTMRLELVVKPPKAPELRLVRVFKRKA